MLRSHLRNTIASCLLAAVSLTGSASLAQDRFDSLANLPFEQNRPTEETAKTLMEELTFQRATQSYIWAMPLLNTMGMRFGFAESYEPTYNTMAIWTKRLDARTKITTPNSDLIYGMTFVNLADTGPLVFEAPPKLQGILLDAWQRPIPEDSGDFFGDVGLPGPDAGAGGNFLILPPGYDGDVPDGYYVYRSATNNVFIFLRAFYTDLADISPPTELLKQSLIYPLGQKDSAEPMVFPDASESGHEMLPRTDVTAFEHLKNLVDTEGGNLAGPDWLGMLQYLGIEQGKPFEPDERTTEILNDAAETAYKTTRVIGLQNQLNGVDLRVYEDRQWANPINNLAGQFPNGFVDLTWMSADGTYRNIDARAWMFTDYYSMSPGMVSMTPGKGAYYMMAFEDSEGEPLVGDNTYQLTLPADIPADLFWSVTLYEAENASGLDNGQPFPSLGQLNNPAQEDDGSTVLHIGPEAPEGEEGHWLATVPGRGFLPILRLYVPTEAAIEGTWKPGDLVKVED